MEIISAKQLEQYEGILSQINGEFEKAEQLKREVEKAENSIITMKLSLADYRKQISHVTVKIFNEIWQIYNLYGEEVAHYHMDNLHTYDNCKFYLIEIFVAKSLLSKLLDSQWKLQVQVVCDSFSINKIVHIIPNKTPIMVIVPVNSEVRSCIVEASLFTESENSYHIISLNSVAIDISYHFESTASSIKCTNLAKNLFKLAQLYNRDSSSLCTVPLRLQSQIKCNFANNDIVTHLVKHSYHRLDLDMFSEFSDDIKRAVALQFSIENSKVALQYNKDLNVVKLKCDAEEMAELKKFFLAFAPKEYLVKKRKQIISQKASVVDTELDELITLHEQFRRV